MNSATRWALRLVPLALLAAPICAGAQGGKAPAMDSLPADYEMGESLVCDTLEQVEMFADLFTGDAQTAIRVVNEAEHDPSACGIVKVAFMRGDKHGVIRHGERAFEIVHILVVGVEADRGIRPVRPAAFYSLFEVKEFAI
jgi:hypothetical protein